MTQGLAVKGTQDYLYIIVKLVELAEPGFELAEPGFSSHLSKQ